MQLRRLTPLGAPMMSSLIGALVLTLAVGSAVAQDMVRRWPGDHRYSKASALRTSAVTDPDTVWLGHVQLTAGYGPNHIGRGARLISGGTIGGGPLSKPASSYEGTFNFDFYQAGETDSLQGWWPIQAPFGSVGPS